MGYIGPNSYGGNLFKSLQTLLQRPLTVEELVIIEQQLATGGVPVQGGDLLAGKLLLAQLMSQQSDMSAFEMGLFLKNILQVPKEMQTLLAILATQPEQVAPETLKKLLEENPDLKISLEELQQMMGNHTEDGQKKLMKLLQTNQMGFTGEGKTLGEVLKMTSEVGQKVKASPTEALNTVMLLYLPFYPLVEQQKLRLDFEFPEDEGGGGGGDAYSLVLFIETNTLGKFKISVGVLRQTQLLINLEHDAIAVPYLSQVEKDMIEAAGQDGLPPPLFTYAERTVPAHEKERAELEQLEGKSDGKRFKTFQEDNKKIAIHPSQGVSVLVVNGAYLLARIIFEADERNRLLQKRSYRQS